MKTKNADYEIIHQIDLGDKHFVTGYHPTAPASYITWEYIERNDSFHQGHYFGSREDAVLDMFRRAGETLDLNGKSLAMALLSQEERTDLERQFREESEIEEITCALESMADYDDFGYDTQALLADPEFMSLALQRYRNIKHSYEFEAFSEALDSLLDEFPQHRISEIVQNQQVLTRIPGDFTAYTLREALEEQQVEIRIPPEMNKLIKDLLSTPTARIPEKYGPLGDNIEFSFELDNGIMFLAELRPAYGPDPNQLSETQPHYFDIRLYDAQICPVRLTSAAETQLPDLDPSSFTAFRIGLGDDVSITLTILEDQSLSRTGKQFVFNDPSGEYYPEHNGEVCTVRRILTPEEYDVLQSGGLMWEIEFDNGDVISAFDRELTSPEPQKKLTLSQQINRAQSKVEPPASSGKPPKNPEL